ncbi:hypothetical protein AB0L82_40925 [Nocardia sp. NPDC052001]|uniref:hypothetical protein n=1 Tax=Nocardia sp. NPDC052001 TaxID=3154853 RepID=UPI0034497DFA
MKLVLALGIPVALLALVLVFLVLVLGGIDTAVASDFEHQCDVAIPNASSTATSAVRTSERVPVTANPAPTPTPTENPYARLTFASDDPSVSDRQRACASAMRTAVYQGTPLSEPATGATAQCAGEILAALVNRSSSNRASVEPAAVTAAVLHLASTATTTGYCRPLADTDVTTLLGARSGRNPDQCPSASAKTALVLPDSLAAQSLCGQLVAGGAESPGDLVFWDYRGNMPTRVGVVIGYGQSSAGPALVFGSDPDTGSMAQMTMPRSWDVRVKRVLGAAV